MVITRKVFSMARGSPQKDVQAHRPTPVTSGQELSCRERARLTTRVQTQKRKIHFATWNIGTPKEHVKELADVLAKLQAEGGRGVLQETLWKGSTSRLIGNGYKLIYTGASGGTNGIAIVLRRSPKQHPGAETS